MKSRSTADIMADIRKRQKSSEDEIFEIKAGTVFPALVAAELGSARQSHPEKFHSAHEGLSILQEEFEELKAEVYIKIRSKEKICEELVQLAAMCQRFYEDLYEEQS